VFSGFVCLFRVRACVRACACACVCVRVCACALFPGSVRFSKSNKKIFTRFLDDFDDEADDDSDTNKSTTTVPVVKTMMTISRPNDETGTHSLLRRNRCR